MIAIPRPTETAESLALASPIPCAGNARTHSEAQVALVAGSNCTSGAKAR